MVDASVAKDLRQISHGDVTAKKYSRYDVNGYRFRTAKLEASRPLAATSNSGVVTTSSNASGDIFDYYGVIQNIIEYSFGGDKELKAVFFDCVWFDPHNGVFVDEFGMVEVLHSTRLQGQFNNFVLAHQVAQVYYLTYPHPSFKARWVAFRVNAQLSPPDDSTYVDLQRQEEAVGVYQDEALGDTFDVDEGTGLSEMPTNQLEMMTDEPGPSTRPPRRSKRISRIQARLAEARVAEADSDADDF